MSEGTFESRVAILESRVDGIERLCMDINETQKLHWETIHGMDKKIDLILSKGSCPSPGLCIAMSPRIDSLELSRAQAVASWKTFTFMGGAMIALSASIGGLVSWVVSQVHHKP